MAALLLLVPLSGAIPLVPPQDDAGRGGDAPDAWPLGIKVDDSDYDHPGSLADRTDLADVYLLLPPEHAIIRLSGEVGELTVKIVNPDRVVQACGKGPGRLQWSTIVTEPGEWELRFDRSDCSGIFSPAPVHPLKESAATAAYKFRWDYESHEHYAEFSFGDAYVKTIQAHFPGTFGRLELQYVPIGDPAFGPWSFSYVARAQPAGGRPASQGLMWVFTPYAGLGFPTVWIDGVLPEGLLAEVIPIPPGLGSFRFAAESEDDLLFHLGFAHSAGVSIRAWAVWDGPEFQVDAMLNDEAVFRSFHDYDSDGLAVQVGPYVKADHLWTTFTTDERRAELFVSGRIPLVDPQLPPASLASTETIVTRPDGDLWDLTNRSAFLSWGEVPQGEWRVDVHDVDGLWSNSLRFIGINFDMPFP